MFIERLILLLKEQKITSSKMLSDLGLGKNQITYWKQNGNIPKWETVEKIAEYFGVSVDYLIGKTDIKKDPPGVMPIGDLVGLRVIASVHAGFDGTAVVNWDGEYEAIPVSMLHGYPPEECVLFKVKGNSMYPKILDGDKIVVHEQISVDPGDTAIVVYNNDEGTVKKVNYVYGEDWLELIPTNPEYPTKRIEGAELEKCHVFGKVIGLLRDSI